MTRGGFRARALRSVAGAIRRLGWERGSSLGGALGRFVHHPLGIRRELVQRQLRLAFPDLSGPELDRLAAESYDNLGRTTLEGLLLPAQSHQQIVDLFAEVEGFELVREATDRGSGMLIVSGHLGNWELAAAYLAARGVRLDVVARPLSDPAVEAIVADTRRALGLGLILENEAVRAVPRALRAGRVVAMLADQGALGPASTFVPFFGRPAKTPRGPAVFALRLGVPLVYAAATRLADGRFRFQLDPVPLPSTGDREADVDETVRRYTQRIERAVRETPGQYFWQHNRWKWQPVESSGASGGAGGDRHGRARLQASPDEAPTKR